MPTVILKKDESQFCYREFGNSFSSFYITLTFTIKLISMKGGGGKSSKFFHILEKKRARERL